MLTSYINNVKAIFLAVLVVSGDHACPRPLSTVVKASSTSEPLSRARILAAMMDKVTEILDSTSRSSDDRCDDDIL